MTLLPLRDSLEWSYTTLRANSTLLIQVFMGPAIEGPALACLPALTSHLWPLILPAPTTVACFLCQDQT